MTLRRIVCAAVVAASLVGARPAAAQPTSWLARAADAVRGQLAADRPRVLRRSIELEDASLQTLKDRLAWIGIDIPFELQGDVTTRLGVEVDLSALRDARSYRIEGSLSSDRLVVEGLELRDLSAAARYVEGRLTLEQLVATVPDVRPNGAAGRAIGEATMQLLPAGGLSATLRLTGAPLEPLRRQLDAEAFAGGRITGQVTVEMPVSNLRDVKAWRGTGRATVTDLVVAGRRVSRAQASAELAEGVLTLASVAATIEEEQVTGSGTLGLIAPFPYEATIDVPEGELSRLDVLIGRALPNEWSGPYRLTARMDGTLEPRVMNVTGEVTVANLVAARRTFEAARFAGRLAPDAVELTTLELTTAEGRLTGSGTIRRNEDRTFSLRLRPERFDLAALDPVIAVALQEEAQGERATVAYRALQNDDENRPSPPAAAGGDQSGPTLRVGQSDSENRTTLNRTTLSGTATGQVEVRGQTVPFKLDALEGSLTFEDLTIAGVTFDRAEIVAETQERTLVLSRLTLVRGEGRLTGEGRFGLDAPGTFTATVRPENFSIDEARPLFGEGGVADFELPPISGRVDGEVTVAGQTQPFELESLRGDLAGDDIRVGALLIDRFEVAAETADDVITISDLLIVVEDGRLTGRASLGLEGERPFEATLRPEAFRIELLRPLFGEGGVIETDFPPVSGRVTGEVTLRGRAEPGAIDGVSGKVSSEGLSISGARFERARFVVETEEGVATLREFLGESDFGTLTGTATLRLASPYDYAADLTFDEFDLSLIGRFAAGITEEQRPDIASPAEVAEGPGVLPVELEGLADLRGRIRGTFAPFVLAGEGAAAADRLVLDAGDVSEVFRATTLASPRFEWRYDERRLTLADITAGVGGGTLSGTAAVPLGDAAAGALDLQITNVELSDILKLPGDVGGGATGRITAEVGPVGEEEGRPVTGRASLAIPALRAGRIAAGDVAATVMFDRELFEYDITGRLFDGELAAKGSWPLDDAAENAAAGTIRWAGVNLARAAASVSDDPRVTGRLDAAVEYDLSAATKGTGTVELSNVRTDEGLVTDRLTARVVWADSVIRVENAAGGFAGGTVSFAILLDAADPRRGSVELLLRRVDANRAFGWIPGLEPLAGIADVRLRGRLGSLWHWRGEADIARGTYGPIAFSSWRVPIEIDANPRRAAMRVELRRTSLRAARGRGVLNLSYLAGASSRFELDATFRDMDAGQLLDGDGLSERVAGGRVSGTVELSSRNLRSIADLEGTVFATLEGTQARGLPVIGSVVDFARLPTGGGGTVERGEVRVFVRRGVARVEELALAGPSFRLFAEGTIALGSQRLALDVVADTSPARADRILAGFLLRQIVDYGTPIGWIERANRFIAERAIYLRVTGTVGRPVVRVRPVEQLGQEAVRFLLSEIAGPVGPQGIDTRP